MPNALAWAFVTTLLSTLGFSLISGCSYNLSASRSTPTLYPLEASKPAELIPRSIFFSKEGYEHVGLSPDGRWLSFKKRNGELNELFIAPLHNLRAAISVSQTLDKPITGYQWSFLPDTLLLSVDNQGNNNHKWYQVDVNSLKTSAITDFGEEVTAFIKTFADNPSQILVSANAIDSKFFDAFRFDLITGKKLHIPRSKRWTTAFYNQHFQLKVGCNLNQDIQFKCYDVTKAKASLIFELPKGHYSLDAFLTNNGDFVYALPATKTELTSINRYRFVDKTQLKLATATQGELSFALKPYPDLYQQEYLFKPIAVTESILDNSHSNTLKQRLDFLGALLGKEHFEILSRTLDDNQWLIYVDDITGSPRYALFDTARLKLQTLVYQLPQLQTHLADPMMPIEIVAQDGLVLPSYFSAPLDQIIKTGEHSFKTLQPLPTVLFVQGGHWARDQYQYQNFVQWLTNRGYAVLQVNYRGSRGFGRHPMSTGKHEFAKKMHQALLDAVDWGVRQGLVDPNRLGILGGSYGGYTALVGMSFTPERFTCGVDLGGIRFWHDMADDLNTARSKQRLKAAYPLIKADQIRNPFLMIHGTNDPRVTQQASDQMVAAIQRRKGQVTYAIYPDEKHEFKQLANAQVGYALIENFLAKHLGSRAEPIQPKELMDSNVQIIVGSQLIPSLQQAQRLADKQALENSSLKQPSFKQQPIDKPAASEGLSSSDI
jgi:dienelactone hydrolase